jgi:MFS family permease
MIGQVEGLKALGGTIVGNTMEWYDVGVFGYLITTMGPVFLPEADRAVQNLFLLGTFGATFIARPLGGIFFGWLGDKIGRQKVLAMTLMMMAAATFVVGLLPGYAVLGIWAAVLLVVTKLVQGLFHRRRVLRAPPPSCASTRRTTAAASSSASWTWAATSALRWAPHWCPPSS